MNFHPHLTYILADFGQIQY